MATIDAGAQFLAGLEERDGLGRHFHRLARARVAPFPGIPFSDGEGSKAAQLDPVSAGKRIANFTENDIDHLFHVFVTKVRVLSREFLYELGFKHRIVIKCICGGSARPPPQTFREI